MANSGRDTNACQFFVTLKPAPHLDGKHVVFGQVISGIEVIRAISKVPTDIYEHPRIPVQIFDCGQLDDLGKPIRGIEASTEQNSGVKVSIDKGSSDAVAQFDKLREAKFQAKLLKQSQRELSDEDEEVKEEEKQNQSDKQSELLDKVSQKKLELQMKMNEARKSNNRAVVEEKERFTDPTYEKRRNKDELWKEKRSV